MCSTHSEKEKKKTHKSKDIQNIIKKLCGSICNKSGTGNVSVTRNKKKSGRSTLERSQNEEPPFRIKTEIGNLQR